MTIYRGTSTAATCRSLVLLSVVRGLRHSNHVRSGCWLHRNRHRQDAGGGTLGFVRWLRFLCRARGKFLFSGPAGWRCRRRLSQIGIRFLEVAEDRRPGRATSKWENLSLVRRVFVGPEHTPDALHRSECLRRFQAGVAGDVSADRFRFAGQYRALAANACARADGASAIRCCRHHGPLDRDSQVGSRCAASTR